MARFRAPLLLVPFALAGVVVTAARPVSAVPPSAGVRSLASFIRNDVIPAPDVDFARVADLDGDGDLDFLTVESAGENIDWWDNTDGDGSRFTEHPITPSSGGVKVVAPGDVDHDGDMDFFALPANGRVEVWRNDGHGAFDELARTTLLSANATYIEAADVNGDGFGDFFSVDTKLDRIDWYLNDAKAADPAFTSHLVATNASPADKVQRLDAADMDHDGLVDFVTADTDGGRMAWWRHTVSAQGEHGFANQTPGLGLRQEAVEDVAAADIDRDGRMDIFALRMMPYRAFAWLRQADGGFASSTQPLADIGSGALMWKSIDAGDVNRDGAVDMVIAEPGSGGRLCWYQNPDSGPVITPTSATESTPTITPSPTSSTGSTPTPTVTVTRTVTRTPTPGTPPTVTRTATRPPGLRFHALFPLALQRR